MPVPRATRFVAILLGCLAIVAPANAADDPVAAARAEQSQQAQQAYERILAAQTEPLATTAEEVIDRCLEAMGGREAVASLRTMTLTTEGHMMGGLFGGTRHQMAPNFNRYDWGEGRGYVTDGVSAWRIDGDQWELVPVEDAGWQHWQQILSISLDLIDYAGKRVTYEFVDTVPLEGGAFYRLRKTISTGKVVHVYFNVETGLLMMEEETGDNGWMANLFYDHREVAGVKLPHMRVRLAEIIETAHVAFMTYEANPPLDKTLFVRP